MAQQGATMRGVVILSHRVFVSLCQRRTLSAFGCSDKACSRKRREAWGPHLLCFHLRETGVRDQGSQLVQAAAPSVKARRLARSVLLACEIGNDEAPTWFEHPRDFRESLPFEARRQMMHHQGREHHIERLIGKGELLDHPDLELDRHLVPSSFRASTGDLLWSWVNAEDAARSANAALDFDRQRSRAAAHIQHRLSTLNAGQVGGSLPQLVQLAAEQERVEEPSHQVVAPAQIEDQPVCLFGRRLARFAVVVMCEPMHQSCSFQRKPLFTYLHPYHAERCWNAT